MEIVEQREAVRVLPEEGNGVAVDMRHHDLALLLGLQGRIHRGCNVGGIDHRGRGRRVAGEVQTFLVEGVAVVLGDRLGGRVRVHVVDVAGVAVIHRVGVLGIQLHRGAVGVLDGARDQERADRRDAAVDVLYQRIIAAREERCGL